MIYTVMAGKYGKVLQPLVTDDSFDYILFSNDLSGTVGVWKVRPIPCAIQNDNKRLSRYPKTHPVSLLSDYSASLYLDANIQIVDSWVYDRFRQLVELNDVNIAGIQLVYTGRDCVYYHSYDMCVMKAEHDYNAIVQMHALRRLGFPEHWGLNENNLIWRRHNKFVEEIDDEWWWWITNYSYRDQFSYMYCLWKFKEKRHFFLPVGETTTNSVHFNRIYHNDDPVVASKKWVRNGFFEFIRNKCRTINDNTYRSCAEQYVFISKLPLPRVSLFVWGLFAMLFYIPVFIIKKSITR